MSNWQTPGPAGFGAAPGGNEPMRSIPFEAEEVGTIGTMATFMMIAGGLGILKALADFGLQGLAGVIALTKSARLGLPFVGNMLGGLVTAVIAIALGAWLIIGARAFKRVVSTDEADQHHLAHGLRQLRNVFLLKSLVILATLMLACLGFIVSAVLTQV